MVTSAVSRRRKEAGAPRLRQTALGFTSADRSNTVAFKMLQRCERLIGPPSWHQGCLGGVGAQWSAAPAGARRLHLSARALSTMPRRRIRRRTEDEKLDFSSSASSRTPQNRADAVRCEARGRGGNVLQHPSSSSQPRSTEISFVRAQTRLAWFAPTHYVSSFRVHKSPGFGSF